MVLYTFKKVNMLGHLDKLNCNLVTETNVRGVKDWGGGFFYSTVWYCKVQYSNSTIQYSTIQCKNAPGNRRRRSKKR